MVDSIEPYLDLRNLLPNRNVKGNREQFVGGGLDRLGLKMGRRVAVDLVASPEETDKYDQEECRLRQSEGRIEKLDNKCNDI